MAADLDFTGKTVLITGAATGIGRATALAFGENGANVVIGDVDDRGAKTAEDIEAAGGRAVFLKTDVTDAAQQEALVALAVSEFGSLDAAFNNAGILPPTAPLLEQTVEDWNRVMSIDVTGVFLGLKAQLAVMVEQGHGSIINTASVAGLRADPFMVPYTAAKHAVVGITKGAALDYATDGVRVNAIAPGLVRSPMTERWLADPETRARVLADSPIKRAIEPEEIAGLVLFLASDVTTAITGAVYEIDGARTTH